MSVLENENLESEQNIQAELEFLREESKQLKAGIKACRDCNDAGEDYKAKTPDAAQCLANLFSMVDEDCEGLS